MSGETTDAVSIMIYMMAVNFALYQPKCQADNVWYETGLQKLTLLNQELSYNEPNEGCDESYIYFTPSTKTLLLDFPYGSKG